MNLRKFWAQVGAELDPRAVATTVRSAIYDAHESIVEREAVEDLIDALTVRLFEPPRKLKLSPLAPAGFPNQQADNDRIILCARSLY